MNDPTMQSADESLLFRPIRIGTTELTGRVIKSAVTETLCDEGGYVTDELIALYTEWARGGTPLLITGATHFSTYSQGIEGSMCLDDDDKIPGLRRLTDAVHEKGSKIFSQIFHVGRQAVPAMLGRDVSLGPSAVHELATGVTPRAMTADEIRETVEGFGQAARRAKEAGFDGVQIHAAHGYLISAFLTPYTNRRKDEYGGTVENRMRFLVEVYREVRRTVGADYPLILKLNGHDGLLPWRKGLGTAELVEVARRMEREGIDGVEISAGHYESFGTFIRGRWKGFARTLVGKGIGKGWPTSQRLLLRLGAPLVDAVFNWRAGYRPAFNLDYATEFKKVLDIPVISVGGFHGREDMDEALDAGRCDIIGAARAFVSDPHLYEHLKRGVQGPRCNACQKCFATTGSARIGCFDPVVGAETRRMLKEEAQLPGAAGA